MSSARWLLELVGRHSQPAPADEAARRRDFALACLTVAITGATFALTTSRLGFGLLSAALLLNVLRMLWLHWIRPR